LLSLLVERRTLGGMAEPISRSAARERERRFEAFDAWVDHLPAALREMLSVRQAGTVDWHLVTMRVKRSPGQYSERDSAIHRVADVPPGWARAAGRPY
jgi:hypothetical protein